jgi:hypothetical protein
VFLATARDERIGQVKRTHRISGGGSRNDAAIDAWLEDGREGADGE